MQAKKMRASTIRTTSQRLRNAIIEGTHASEMIRLKQLNKQGVKICPLLREKEILKRALNTPSSQKLAQLGITFTTPQKKY